MKFEYLGKGKGKGTSYIRQRTQAAAPSKACLCRTHGYVIQSCSPKQVCLQPLFPRLFLPQTSDSLRLNVSE